MQSYSFQNFFAFFIPVNLPGLKQTQAAFIQIYSNRPLFVCKPVITNLKLFNLRTMHTTTGEGNLGT